MSANALGNPCGYERFTIFYGLPERPNETLLETEVGIAKVLAREEIFPRQCCSTGNLAAAVESRGPNLRSLSPGANIDDCADELPRKFVALCVMCDSSSWLTRKPFECIRKE